MEVAPDALASQLRQRGLPPLILISGQEPLRVREAVDSVRHLAVEQGCGEREVMRADADFEWTTLLQTSQSMSLFSDRRLLELHLERRPDAAGRQALQAFAAQGAGEDVLMIVAPLLEWKDRKAKWYQALAAAGVAVVAGPVRSNELPAWLRQRASGQGLTLDDEAASLLAERTEGNLLAASQELEKLALLLPQGTIDGPSLLAAVADQSRFTALDLVDSLHRGKLARAQHQLNHLRAEGEALLPLQALLMTNMRQLLTALGNRRQGQSPEQAMQSAGLFRRRQAAAGQALNRLNPPRCHQILARLQHLEATIKGRPDPIDPWLQLGEIARLWCSGTGRSSR